jgi:hypothetical protein
MKITPSILAVAIALTFTLLGCKKEGDTISIDTAAVEKAFSSADSSLKDSAMKAVDAVKKADYAGALSELKSLASNVKLTDDQKKTVNDIIARVQKALTDGMGKAADGTKQAIGDAQKTLGK